MRAETAEKVLKWLLWILGSMAALGAVAIVMPFSWMQRVNDALGLAPLVRTPLTEYLTRSLSAVYALLGVFTIYLGCAVRRYRELIIFVGWLTGALGVVLTGIDLAIGMPLSWTWGEGPPTVLCAAAMVWLGRQVRPL